MRLPRKIDVLKFIGARRSKCIFLHLKKEKKRVSPARGAKFERDKRQFWRRRDSGFAGIYIYINMCGSDAGYIQTCWKKQPKHGGLEH